MPNIPSIMALHLRYRLWIAEMNFDINVMRILEDYLTELTPKSHEPGIKEGIDRFERDLVSFRKEIDDLRHEMHILKMKLAAYTRENTTITEDIYKSDNHEALKGRYLAFRESFEQMKKDFSQLTANV
jgi:hypothetical protein